MVHLRPRRTSSAPNRSSLADPQKRRTIARSSTKAGARDLDFCQGRRCNEMARSRSRGTHVERGHDVDRFTSDETTRACTAPTRLAARPPTSRTPLGGRFAPSPTKGPSLRLSTLAAVGAPGPSAGGQRARRRRWAVLERTEVTAPMGVAMTSARDDPIAGGGADPSRPRGPAATLQPLADGT